MISTCFAMAAPTRPAGPPIDGKGLATTATTEARHDQLANATLAAWFGTQTCYLAMAAMPAC